MEGSSGLRRLLDRAAIQDVLMRYFHGVDSGDRNLVRGCFADDVVAQYEGRPPVRGVDALIEQIALFENLATGRCKVSTHFAGNLQFVELTDDRAETVNNAFAFLASADGTTVSMRSLRYLDRLRLDQGRWKVVARLHTLDWSCDVPCTYARAFAEKVGGMPAPLQI